MTRKAIVVAIDGPGGAGKSTVSRMLAARLGYRYVDTGAMYRVIGVLAARNGLTEEDIDALSALCRSTEFRFDEIGGQPRVFAGGVDLTAAIRTPEAAQQASRISTIPEVRERLVELQRSYGADGGVVMEGRDIGTAVFPQAAVKVFLDASPEVRARRRASEGGGDVDEAQIEAVAREIAERDQRDRSRSHSPLRAAEDAVVVDTTAESIDAVVDRLYELVSARGKGLASQGPGRYDSR